MESQNIFIKVPNSILNDAEAVTAHVNSEAAKLGVEIVSIERRGLVADDFIQDQITFDVLTRPLTS